MSLPKALLVLILFAAFQASQAQVIISEFMASNTRTLLDEDGDTSDWIEVFNLGQTNVNLNGWALTDTRSNPRKWRFPSVDLPAGANIIVFASGKNRHVAGSPLHTNFKLTSNPGYVGLADPTGAIVFDYGDLYPEQAPDVSFGVVWEETRSTILTTNAPSRYIVPGDDSLGLGWTLLEFPTDIWQSATGAIGYDLNPPAPDDPWLTAHTNLAPQIFYRFEGAGLTVTNSGSWGEAYNATYTGGVLSGQIGLQPPTAPGLPTNNLTPRFDGANDYVNSARTPLSNLSAFTMAAWVKPGLLTKQRVGLWGQHDAIEFGFIDMHTLQLSTANGGAVQADFPLPANVWHFVAVSGDGELLRIYIDGLMVGEGGNAAGNYGASAYPFVIGGGGIFDASQNWFTGNIDEFSLYTRALSPDDLFLLYKSAMAPTTTYASIIGADVMSQLNGVNSSLYSRYEIVTTNAFNGLIFNVQNDDGFVAYLNGVEIARNNAPDEPLWNSTATGSRIDRSGLRPLQFDLTHYAGLLHTGTNLLAIQSLNAAADDADLLVQPELIGIGRNVQTNVIRYFVQPTPGRINGVGDTNAGPLIVSANYSPKIPEADQPITVTARLIRTFNAPSELTL
ncbi:MAG TPA: LamG-like jellyroll fold domain-containing protein, partial [Verrucomicrobiae bacterium]